DQTVQSAAHYEDPSNRIELQAEGGAAFANSEVGGVIRLRSGTHGEGRLRAGGAPSRSATIIIAATTTTLTEARYTATPGSCHLVAATGSPTSSAANWQRCAPSSSRGAPAA